MWGLVPAAFTGSPPAWRRCRQSDLAFMAASSSSGSLWWDRDVDGKGRVIRADVREAGHKVWKEATRRVWLKCGDEADAGWLMECAVEQISRYLDRKNQPVFSRDLQWLLMTAVCRLVRRHKKKLERLELVGSLSDLPQRKTESDWVRRADSRVELSRIRRSLSAESCAILTLRTAGFGWHEIAGTLKLPETTVRRRFWRDIGRARALLEKPRPE